MPNSIEQNTERFALLPYDAQEAIKSFEYDKALQEIHTGHKLHIDQAAALEKAVADVIFGDMHSRQLVSTIQQELRLTAEQATQLAVEVNQKILHPIQEKMQQIESEE